MHMSVPTQIEGLEVLLDTLTILVVVYTITWRNLLQVSLLHNTFYCPRSPEGGNGTRSSVLAGEIPWTEEPDRQATHGVARVGHELAAKQQQTA